MKTPNLQHTKVFVSDNGRRELVNEFIEPADLQARIDYLTAHTIDNPVNTRFHCWFAYGTQLI